VSYQPREFWERRLSEQFDLRGTGQTGLSLAYNRACYALRRAVLDRALRAADFDPRGRRVLDVGCGTGFFTAYYLERGAALTGIDIAPISIERLRARHPGARFMLGDVSELPLDGSWDLVNAFDVLYHITDDARWERALAHLAEAVSPGGLLLVTDTFEERPGLAAHNRMRSLARHRAVLEPRGFTLAPLRPTHVLLNRELGLLRFVNRLPGMLLAIDRALLAIAPTPRLALNKLLVARRER
jgi:SAM-dependent methyltransferase